MKSEVRIRELRTFLETRHISPEAFGKQVELSHMTIRRWLRKPDTWVIPHKYHPILREGFGPDKNTQSPEVTHALADLDISSLMKGIEKSGEKGDLKSIEKELTQKKKKTRLDQVFWRFCETLLKTARSTSSTTQARAIAIGALLYFINPIDLIPDEIPLVGYLDDLAILSLAVNYILELAKT